MTEIRGFAPHLNGHCLISYEKQAPLFARICTTIELAQELIYSQAKQTSTVWKFKSKWGHYGTFRWSYRDIWAWTSVLSPRALRADVIQCVRILSKWQITFRVSKRVVYKQVEFDKTAVNLGTFARSEHLPSCFKKRLWSSIFTRIKYLPHTFTNWINNPRITHSSQHPLSELCTQIQNESNLTILSLSGVLNDKKSKCQELFSCARSLPQFPARLLTRVLKREINKVNTWLWFFSQVSFVMSCTFPVNFFPVPVDVTHQRFQFPSRFWADHVFDGNTCEQFEIASRIPSLALIQSLIYLNEILWFRNLCLK